ncbi:MAG TPA: CPBP family intramembrane glutamic endopeptidase [Cyclobacteriaceae bacterium]|nr:CPBP family intramembrane glutamic endopeptidase [Cyclobacteriaceae bacterium]
MAFVVLIVTVFSFGLVAQMIGLVVAYFMYGGDFAVFANDIANPTGHEAMKAPLMVAQAITTVLGLAVIPPLFWWTMRRKSLVTFFNETRVTPLQLLYTIGILVFFMIVNSATIEWNSGLDYPGAFGEWSRMIEDKAMELTKFMASNTGIGDYLAAVMVIAVFAAIGEEIVFRGLLQTELHKAFKNIHLAIWISAIFFSAFHLQFYGFFPRLLLGALFGYMYYWSGNMIVPMFAHFVNNIAAVSALYFGMEEADDPSVAPWYAVVIALIIGSFLLYRFYLLRPQPVNIQPSNDQPA